MQYCVDHPEEINKLSKVKAQVSEVKGVMMENIEKVKQLHPYYFLSSVARKLCKYIVLFFLWVG
jgi:vesicle-associated membrane protein 72